MNIPAPIVLVGFMGGGKTTVGRILARRLGRRFVDLDELVALASGSPVAELIARRGEESFRRAESRALARAMTTRNTVIATGGGAVLRARNRDLLRRAGGPVIWLQVTADTARSRAGAEPGSRPLLPDEPAATADLLGDRERFYGLVATEAVATDSLSPEETATEIASRLAAPAQEPTPRLDGPVVVGGDGLPCGHGPVLIGAHLVGRVAALPGFPGDVGGPVLVLSEPLAYALCGSELVTGLRGAGLRPLVHLLPDGEPAKSVRGLAGAWEAALAGSLERNGLVVTLGGGAVTDVGGLAAATYARGVRVVHLPTTLLAQVDAAIGGKTGINFGGAKNLVGCFHWPSLVVADADVLRHLPDPLVLEGLVEGAKAMLVGGLSPGAIRHRLKGDVPRLVAAAVRAKLRIVRDDPLERGARESLNLGHTFAHALEAAAGLGGTRHGLAVGVGCVAAVELARRMELVSETEAEAVRALFGGLVARFPATDRRRLARLEPRAVLAWLSSDKKRRSGRTRLVLLKSASPTDHRPVPARLEPVVVTDPRPDLVETALVLALERAGDPACPY